MSEQAIEGQGETQSVDNTQGISTETSPAEGTGINPAWSELLDSLPSQLQPIVTPHLEKWDKNYQEGIGKVHSEYADFKPFKDQGYTPDQINYGLQVLDMLENRPQDVYAAMQEYFKEESPVAEANNEQGLNQPIDDSAKQALLEMPEFKQMQELVTQMGQQFQSQQQQQEQAQQDAELQSEFDKAKETHGDFDESWVIAKVLASPGLSIQDAAAQYAEFEKAILAKHNTPAPRVLSGGGQTPSQSTPISELSDKDRRAHIASILQAAAAQNG